MTDKDKIDIIDEDSEESIVVDGEWFEMFKKEVEYWIDYFGLKEYELHIDNEEECEALGTCYCDSTNKHAVITLSTDWCGEEPTERRVKQIAFHEVAELLLSNLKILINERFISEYSVDSEIHDVIRRLENTVFKDKYEANICKCYGGCNEKIDKKVS